jgi:hypothetical protein
MKREYWENIGLERELINLIMAENGRDIESLKTRADAACAERDALAAQLSDSKAESEAALAKAGLADLFGRAGFACTLIRDAALARYIAEGGTVEGVGTWLTALRKSEPGAFAQNEPEASLPRFSVAAVSSDDGGAPSGGLFGMLKKLR